MSITNVILLCIVVCVAILLLKNHNPSIGFVISISASVVLLILCLPKLNNVIHTLNNISAKAGIDMSLFEILIKCLGITYLTEWGINICKDAGQNALCAKIELFGRLGVVVIVLPIIEQILNNVISIIK